MFELDSMELLSIFFRSMWSFFKATLFSHPGLMFLVFALFIISIFSKVRKTILGIIIIGLVGGYLKVKGVF